MKSSLLSLPNIPFCPSQMDIAFTEKCNQNCDYCYIDRSNPHVLDFASIKKAIDIFTSLPRNETGIIFSCTEPLIYPLGLYKESVNYILLKKQQRNINTHISTATNGILLNKEMRTFIINKLNKDFVLNISFDGKQKSYDAHRRLYGNPKLSAFGLVWRNLNALPKDKVRIMITVTPSEVSFLRENVDFIFKNGFKNIDIFPQLFTIWPQTKLKGLRKELILLSRYFNDLENDFNVRILDRLWGQSHYATISLGSDGKFYLFSMILAVPYLKRKRYIIGDIDGGIDLKKRLHLFNEIYNEALKKSQYKCLKCSYKEFCFALISLFLWCQTHKKNFNQYLKNYCLLAEIFIDLSRELKNEIKNEIDIRKLSQLKST